MSGSLQISIFRTVRFWVGISALSNCLQRPRAISLSTMPEVLSYRGRTDESALCPSTDDLAKLSASGTVMRLASITLARVRRHTGAGNSMETSWFWSFELVGILTEEQRSRGIMRETAGLTPCRGRRHAFSNKEVQPCFRAAAAHQGRALSTVSSPGMIQV